MSAKPRTILVAHPSADLYGSDRMLLESVAAMVAQGWQVVVTLPGPGPLVPELAAQGAEVRFCPVPVLRKSVLRPAGLARFLVASVASVLPCCRLIARFGGGGVYVNTMTIPSWLLLARVMRRRVTAHVHEAEGSASARMRRLLSLPLLLAHRIVVNSTFSLDVLSSANRLLRTRATVIYNGVVGPRKVTPARQVLDQPVRLLYVGRLSPRKGPQVAVAAAAELRRRGRDVRLDLLGSVYPGYEWFEAELRAAVATAGLEDLVTFLGFDADIWSHVQAADVVLVPSVVDEPFGNTAVEALLAARPLVVSATSGLLEAAAGYASATAVPPDRPDLLAAAVEAVIDDWERVRAGAVQDSAVAEQRHSVQRYRQQVIQALTF